MVAVAICYCPVRSHQFSVNFRRYSRRTVLEVEAVAVRPRFYHRHHHTTSFLHMLKLLPAPTRTELPECAGSASEIWCNLCKKRTFFVFMWKPHSPPDYCKIHAVNYVPVSAVWELYLPMNKFTIFKRSSSSSTSSSGQCSTHFEPHIVCPPTTI